MPLNAFVFDARDLDQMWAETHDLTPEDAGVSDHLPIVVDLQWVFPSDE